MIRCYVSGQRVAGFGQNGTRACASGGGTSWPQALFRPERFPVPGAENRYRA
jgi:hypothetical protein